MTGPDTLWVCIAHQRRPDGGLDAVFIIDARTYPDAQTARAACDEAGTELDQRLIPAEFEYITVRADEPAPQLPTWPEYRHTTLSASQPSESQPSGPQPSGLEGTE